MVIGIDAGKLLDLLQRRPQHQEVGSGRSLPGGVAPQRVPQPLVDHIIERIEPELQVVPFLFVRVGIVGRCGHDQVEERQRHGLQVAQSRHLGGLQISLFQQRVVLGLQPLDQALGQRRELVVDYRPRLVDGVLNSQVQCLGVQRRQIFEVALEVSDQLLALFRSSLIRLAAAPAGDMVLERSQLLCGQGDLFVRRGRFRLRFTVLDRQDRILLMAHARQDGQVHLRGQALPLNRLFHQLFKTVIELLKGPDRHHPHQQQDGQQRQGQDQHLGHEFQVGHVSSPSVERVIARSTHGKNRRGSRTASSSSGS